MPLNCSALGNKTFHFV